MAVYQTLYHLRSLAPYDTHVCMQTRIVIAEYVLMRKYTHNTLDCHDSTNSALNPAYSGHAAIQSSPSEPNKVHMSTSSSSRSPKSTRILPRELSPKTPSRAVWQSCRLTPFLISSYKIRTCIKTATSCEKPMQLQHTMSFMLRCIVDTVYTPGI